MIYKRLNSKYLWTKFQFCGEKVDESTKCTSRRKAEEYETNKRAQLNLGRIGVKDKFVKADKMLFKDAVASFFEYLDDVKDSTVKRYETASKPLLEYFGHYAVDAITADNVIKYRKHRREHKHKAPARLLKKDPKAKTNKPIQPATINRETTLMAMVYKHLRVAKQMNLPLPTADVKQLDEDNIVERVIEIDEFISYLRNASQPLRDVARLMYYTGMRPSEITSLRVTDIHFTAGVITVRHGKTKSAARRVPLQGPARYILQRRCRKAHNGLLFPGGKNAMATVPIVKLNSAHNGAVKRSGVEPFRLYDIRHTWATHTHHAGVDLETLRVLGGWSNLAMLKRYVKPNDDKKASEMQKLADYRNSVIQVNATNGYVN